ncbi:hypothetical protein UPYG_G00289560 [Umbra pygmaea]|uniref:Uncharacterized protein n=1 Tax=Umbra pygmaea TaxID=75934 RepID=A0ABD0W4I7_UMBPY
MESCAQADHARGCVGVQEEHGPCSQEALCYGAPRWTVPRFDMVGLFDMARLRLQAPVRRSSSRNMEDNNLHRTHDSRRFRQGDRDSVCLEAPGELSRAGQRVDIHREAQHSITSPGRTPVHDNFELPTPQQQNYYLMNAEGHPMRGSLLESESTFIDPMGGVFPVPITPEQKTQLSARERRRSRRTDLQNELGRSRHPMSQTENFLKLDACLDVEKHHRSDRLPLTLRTADRPGDEDGSQQDSTCSPDPRGSIDTVATETWMRPGTSETLKRLMSGQTLRRERLARASAIQDWEGPSTYHG